MTTWKPDDKEWRKTRKEAWKEVKPQLDRLPFLEKEQKATLKNWFITGADNPEAPFNKITAVPLLDMWLHPDQDENRWQELKKKYEKWQWDDAIRWFKSRAKGFSGNHDYETAFSGLEQRLYYFFYNGHLNRSDYEMSDSEFQEAVKGLYRGLMQKFDWFFDDPNPSKYDIRFCRLQEWHEALLSAYHDCDELEWTIEWIEKILGDIEKSHPIHADFAQKINDILSDPKLPQAAKDRIFELRKKYKK